MSTLGLVPLLNFGEVIPGKVYRSAQPHYLFQYKWLREKVGIRYIINLRAESIDESKATRFGIEVYNLAITDHHSPTITQAQVFVDLITKLKGPVLIHCEHGRGRTSLFIVLLRLSQGWSLDNALKEEADQYGYSFPHKAQLDWLQQNKDLVNFSI